MIWRGGGEEKIAAEWGKPLKKGSTDKEWIKTI